MRVAIRVDTSTTIGGGHLQRCLSLAYALRDGGATVSLVLRDLGVDGHAKVSAAGFTALALPPPRLEDHTVDGAPHGDWAGVDWRVDAQQTCRALRDAATATPHWLVVDHYAFDARWHDVVGTDLGCNIAVIDDLADRPLAAQLLIDHNVSRDHRAKYGDRWPRGAALLGGPRYALLGPAFASARRHVPSDSVRSIGIFMGSSDPLGLSEQALRACRSIAGFEGPIEVITTGANPRREALAQAIRSTPATSLLEDVPDLSAFFARHDLQIGAGGGASWERCCIGAPSLLLTAAANQEVVVPQLEALGVAVGLAPGATVQAIGQAVRQLIAAPLGQRQEMSQRARALVDGQGARRVALRLLAGEPTLRPMTLADAELTHKWRNHEHTRGVSRNTEPIDLATHREWLARLLADPQRRIWLASVGQIPVGVIRVDDDEASGDCEVSLYLDPALHGLGLGSALLQAGELERLGDGRTALRFVAAVLPHNLMSRRLFERAGYAFVGGQASKPFVHAAHASVDSPRKATV